MQLKTPDQARQEVGAVDAYLDAFAALVNSDLFRAHREAYAALPQNRRAGLRRPYEPLEALLSPDEWEAYKALPSGG